MRGAMADGLCDRKIIISEGETTEKWIRFPWVALGDESATFSRSFSPFIRGSATRGDMLLLRQRSHLAASINTGASSVFLCLFRKRSCRHRFRQVELNRSSNRIGLHYVFLLEKSTRWTFGVQFTWDGAAGAPAGRRPMRRETSRRAGQ